MTDAIEQGFFPLPFLSRVPRMESDADRVIRLWDDQPVVPTERSLAHLFVARAGQVPERVLIAKRAGDGWASVTYGMMLHRALRIATALRARGLKPCDRILCLSGEGIDHCALQFGAMLARLVTVPISVRYSTSRDRTRLEHVLGLIRPKLVFAEDTPIFYPALDHCAAEGCETLTTGPDGLAALEESAAPVDVETALANIGPDTVFRILLTSGSTAMPKGVLQTHGMSCASLAFEASLRTDGQGLRPPENELSWLPWSHVGGGITIFNNVLYAGRSLYLDDGKPVAGLFGETVRNLKELLPREFPSPPAGLAMLVPILEVDADFRETFLGGLHYVKAGAAAMPDAVGRRFQAMAVETTGHEIPLLSGYGTTETHGVVSLTWPCKAANALGLPKPGVCLKLVPEEDRYEIRIRSASVTPGYFGDPRSTAEAFDEEGYFRTGDMARFDPDRPEEGLFFAGRSGENFKMATGTWVLAGQLRITLLDLLEGQVRDCLVIGEGREELGLMIWGDITSRTEIAGRLTLFNSRNGASQRIRRIIFSDFPIQEEQFERTEKGSLNRGRILAARQEEIDRLYEASCSHSDLRLMVLR